jgi:hypothetical protein
VHPKRDFIGGEQKFRRRKVLTWGEINAVSSFAQANIESTELVTAGRVICQKPVRVLWRSAGGPAISPFILNCCQVLA